MSARFARTMLVAGAVASALAATTVASPAQAQPWQDGRACWSLEGRDRARCERDVRRDRDRSDWERKRRKDAKTDGIVAGVVGTAILGGIIAAAASENKKKERDRRDRCDARDVYDRDYDARSDSYRAADGRWYRCG